MARLGKFLSSTDVQLRKALVVVATVAASAFVGQLGRSWSSRLFVFLAGGYGLVLLVQEPALGLVAMATLSLTLPLSIGTGSEVSLTPPVLLIPAVAAVWLVDGLRKHSVRLPRSPTILPLLLFVASGLVSLLAGHSYWDPMVPQPGNLLLVQLAQWAIFALSAAVFIVAADLGRREPYLHWATFAFLALGAVTTLPWLVPRLWNIVFWHDDANSALLWSWLGALAAGQLLFNRKLSRSARIGLLILLVVLGYVVLIARRNWLSGWIPYTAAVLVAILLRFWRWSKPAALLVALVAVILLVAFFPLLYEYAGGDFEWGVSGEGRLVLYQRTLDTVDGHEILGLGPAAYRHYGFAEWLSLGPGNALYMKPLVSSHNNFVDIYAQMGLVGLVLFLWFLVALAREGWQLASRFDGGFYDGYANGALAGLAATLVAMMLVDWFLPFVYNINFRGFRMSSVAWMFLGALVALKHIASPKHGE